MRTESRKQEDRYEIIIKRLGRQNPVEKDIMGDRETQQILQLIGRLNLRSAFAG
jgi:hypothetical protein